MLEAPAQTEEVEAALSHACFGAYYEVVAAVAAAAHFFGVGAREFAGEGREVGFAGAVAPEGAANAEVVVAAYRYALVVGNRVGAEGVFTQYAGPLVAVVGRKANVAIHNPGHSGVEIERRQVKLGEMDILCRSG